MEALLLIPAGFLLYDTVLFSVGVFALLYRLTCLALARLTPAPEAAPVGALEQGC